MAKRDVVEELKKQRVWVVLSPVKTALGTEPSDCPRAELGSLTLLRSILIEARVADQGGFD